MKSLLELAGGFTQEQVFKEAASKLGFSSSGDVERFIFKAYGKALRDVAPASRPKGAMIFLEPAVIAGALAPKAQLKAFIEQVQVDVKRQVHSLRLDFAGSPIVPTAVTSGDQKEMTGGAWPQSFAQRLSKANKCVLWVDGVSAAVFINGDACFESIDVVEELAGGPGNNVPRLSWDDGAIAWEFAQHELNETGPQGIWRVANKCILRPKPELMMSGSFGKFLQMRMSGYWRHYPEPYIDNSGRVDLIVENVKGDVAIVEVKWTGRSLSSTREHETEDDILAALTKKTSGWFTTFNDPDAFPTGARQLAIYYGSHSFQNGYLVVFDCCEPKSGRANEYRAVDPADVHPHPVAHFRLLRACVDPRKASKISKATKP